MVDLIKFVLSVSGLVMVLNISKLFKPLREAINKWDAVSNQKRSINHMANGVDETYPRWVEKAVIDKVHKNRKNYLSWFLSSIFSCSLCMGVWAGLVVYLVKLTAYGYILEYMCIGACASLLLVTFYQFLEKK